MTDKLLTTAQVAQKLDLVPDSVRYLARKNRIASSIIGRNQRLFKLADVERFVIERQKARSTGK